MVSQLHVGYSPKFQYQKMCQDLKLRAWTPEDEDEKSEAHGLHHMIGVDEHTIAIQPIY